MDSGKFNSGNLQGFNGLRKFSNLMERFINVYGRLPTEKDPDYLEMLRMSKYRILQVPDLNLAKCANCGSAKNDGRKYIDFGLYVEWYGTVFLCTLCIKDIAMNAGLFDELEHRVEELKFSKIKDEEKEELKKAVLHTLEEVKTQFVSLHSSPDGSGSNSSSSVVFSENESTKSGVTKTEQGIIKPTSSSGSKNLSRLTELLPPEQR